MPNQSVSLSNVNYQFITHLAELKKTSFSQILNDLIEDQRLRTQVEKEA